MKVAPSLLLLLLASAADAAAAESSLLSDFTVRRWGVEDGMPEAAVVSVEQRSDGYLWCRTPHYLLKFDGVRFTEAETVQLAPPPARKPTLPPAFAGRIPFPPPGNGAAPNITATMTDAEGALWLGTMRGVYRWKENRWAELTARDGIFPWDVRCLAADREGNTWVGTSGGLVRLRQKRVHIFRTGLPVGSESITALLAESPSKFWVGVAGGGLLTGKPGALRPVRMGLLPENATVSVLLRGRDGDLWIGTQGESLWHQRRDGSVSEVRQANPDRTSARGISALMEDREGRLWVGTWEGLMQVNKQGALVPLPGPEGANLPSDVVQDLFEDRNHQVWVGYQQSGIFLFQPDGTVHRFKKARGQPTGSPFVLHEDAAGTLWIGSTAGLGRWKGNERLLFTSRNGLVDDLVLQILEDEEGDLWLGTRRGLMRVRKSEFDEIAAGRKTVVAARRLGEEAGMAVEECTGRFGARATRTADGRLWFPTMEGLAMVEPKRIARVTAPPPVHLEEVLAKGRLMAAQGNVLRLPRGLRDVEFRFTAPAFTAPEHVHFKFRLEGHDPDWSRATTDRSVVYARLTAGEYRFRAIARDRDSEWSSPTPPLLVVVPAFFWETTWFQVTAGLGLVAALAVGIQAHYRRQAAKEVEVIERRHAVERERARIARDIHDDVGAGLTEVAMLSELAQEESRQPIELQRHLDTIFRRARELTQSLNEIVWAINPSNDTLEGLLSYVAEFTQEFVHSSGKACRLDLPSSPPPLPVSASLRHHLCLAIKEVLHNAAKHSDATEVRLAASLDGKRLTFTIRDNGRGFATAGLPGAEGGRDGLANLRTRIAEIGGTFHQESNPGRGTSTVLSVEIPTGGTSPRDVA